jgi:O-antigen/teichoic acid export membrane protein
MFFLNGLHAALSVYPLSLKGAPAEPAELKRLTGAAIVGSLALSSALGMAFVIGGVVMARAELGALTAIVVVMWMLQETLRRRLMAKLRHDSAIWGDAISYLGQAAIMWLVRARLSLEGVLLVMAATSMAAAFLQAMQVGVGPISIRKSRSAIRDFAVTGRWVFYSSLTSALTTQAYPWAILGFHGPAALAGFQSLANLIRVSHPVLLSTGSVVIPAVAQSYASDGWPRARAVAVRYGLMGALLTFPYFAALIVLPHAVLQFAYGADSAYLAFGQALQIYALGYAILFVCEVAAAFLGGLGDTRANFVAQVLQSFLYMGVGLPLIIRYGVWGAAVGGAVAVVARLGVLGLHVKKHRERMRAAQVGAPIDTAGPSATGSAAPQESVG